MKLEVVKILLNICHSCKNKLLNAKENSVQQSVIPAVTEYCLSVSTNRKLQLSVEQQVTLLSTLYHAQKSSN